MTEVKLKIIRPPKSEEWKSIKDYEGLEVSEYGKVKSFRRDYPRFLKISDVNTVKAEVSLAREKSNKGKWTRRSLVRVFYLVAHNFLDNPYNSPFVRHININIKGEMFNHYTNLEWYSGFENVKNVQWKDVSGREKLKISEYGHVVSTFLILPKPIVTDSLASGIKIIRLTATDYEYIHDLVALEFVDNPENYKFVKPKDGNYQNTHYTNLEWVSSLIDENNNTIWKYISGFSGYKISEFGEVMRDVKSPHLMYKREQKSGLYGVRLMNDERKCVFIKISDLVALEFLDNPKNYKFANHIDGDISNNHYSNLKWSNDPEEVKNDGVEWRTIPLYPNYKVSNTGLVKSFTNRIPKILSSHKDQAGYFNAQIYNKNGGKRFIIHRLVAICFIPNPLNKPVVDHINHDTENNNVENLRWATYSENVINKNPKFNSGNVKKIVQMSLSGEFIKTYESLAEAGRQIGQCDKKIGRCARGEISSFSGYKWEYFDDEEEPYQIQDGELFKELVGIFGDENFIYKNYSISNFGTILNPRGYKKKTCVRDGYSNCELTMNKKSKIFRVHRLVALFFIEGRTKERKFVNHLDSNRQNSHYTNLEWVTAKENMLHSANRKRYNKVIIGLKKTFEI